MDYFKITSITFILSLSIVYLHRKLYPSPYSPRVLPPLDWAADTRAYISARWVDVPKYGSTESLGVEIGELLESIFLILSKILRLEVGFGSSWKCFNILTNKHTQETKKGKLDSLLN